MDLTITHNHRVCSDIHSTHENELQGALNPVADDSNTAKARIAFHRDASNENKLAFANALAWQLRYREALPLFQECRLAGMKVAGRISLCGLKTGSPSLALTLDKELQEQEKPWSYHYHLLLSLYFLGRYEEAIEVVKKCYQPVEDDGELYIAILYWHLLLALKLGKDVAEVKAFDKPLDHGHHVGYNAAVRYFFDKENDVPEEEIDKMDDINRSCLYYGLAVIFEKDKQRYNHYIDKALDMDDIWGSWSYLAAYYERNRK